MIKIKLTDTSGKKIHVTSDQGDGFYLYPGEIKKLKLVDGMELSEEEFWCIWKQYAVPRAKKRALGILAKRDQTEAEVRKKLASSVNDDRSIEEAMHFVKSCGYVDDLSYAREYFQCKRRKKSFCEICLALSGKGIPQDIIELVKEECGEQDTDDLREAFDKYIRKYPADDPKTRARIYAHFARKGYQGALIRKLMEEEL